MSIKLLVEFSAIRLSEEGDAFLQPSVHILHAIDAPPPTDKFTKNVFETDTRHNHLCANPEHGAKSLVADHKPFVRPKHDKTGVEVLYGVHKPFARVVKFLSPFFHAQFQLIMGAA